MTGKLIRQKLVTREEVRANPTILYVFGDNMARRGLGGQAKAMRGEPNAIGIPTKCRPTMESASFFRDSDWDDPAVYDAVVRAFDRIKAALAFGRTVVIPADGLGTGLADLPRRAPRIYEYISMAIAELEAKYP